MALCPYCDQKLGWFEQAHEECVLQYKQKAVQAEHARRQRQQEEERRRLICEREERIREKDERDLSSYAAWRSQHVALVDKFLEITERKVSILDDYGDENWHVLPKEIETLLLKAANADNHDIDLIRRFVFKPLKVQDQRSLRRKFADPFALRMLSDPIILLYLTLKKYLESEFRSYHENRKSDTLIKEFDRLTGVEFEICLAKVLEQHGFEEIRGTPTTGDQGADLITKRDGLTIVIQAKRYEGSVGNRAVQEVAGAVNFYGADEGWVITTGTFTKSAKALAQSCNVKLIDGHDLRDRKFD